MREVIAQAGYMEVLTWALCARDEMYKKMRIADPGNQVVVVKEAKTPDFFQILRTQLVPGLLKVLAENRSYPLPLKLFEVADVTVLVSYDTHPQLPHRHIRGNDVLMQ